MSKEARCQNNLFLLVNKQHPTNLKNLEQIWKDRVAAFFTFLIFILMKKNEFWI